MDSILVEKNPAHQLPGPHKEYSCYPQDNHVSPRNRYSIGANYISARNISSAKVGRVSAHLIPLQSIINNVATPKRNMHNPQAGSIAPTNGPSVAASIATDKIDEQQPLVRVVKTQPKISNNHHLPAVFATEKSQAIKIKKLISKQKLEKYGDMSIDQEPIAVELTVMQTPNHRDRGSKSFFSPIRMISPPAQGNPILTNRPSANVRASHNENQPYIPVTRESARRITMDNNPLGLKTEDSSISGGNSNTNRNNKKRVIVFKKFLSKSPEGKVPVVENAPQNFSNAMKLFNQFAVPIIKPKAKISLNEMITLRKIGTTLNNGIIKRMLHAPSLNIYDIQEEPIKAHENLKEWISQWKKNFHRKDNKHLLKLFTCFWNSPEGNVSVLMEATKRGSLQDLLDMHLSISENCIQQITCNLLRGINEVHQLMKGPHGSICPSEIYFDAQCHPKLSPGISYQAKNKYGSSHSTTHNKDSDKDDSINKYYLINHRVTSTNELRSCSPNRNYLSHGSGTPTQNLPLASDIFDLGYMLLTCALGNLEFYDSTGFYSLDNLKYVIDLLPNHRRYGRNHCCVLHSEEELRRFHTGLSSTTKLRDSGRKAPMTNNFQLKSPRSHDSNSLQNKRAAAPFTLLELLQEGGRFSESFLDFMCNCLRFDPAARLEGRSLLDHEFLSDSHVSVGPLMNLMELMHTNKKDQEADAGEILKEQHLNRVCEAIKIVLINQDARDKITRLATNKEYENPYSREHRKLKELASEIGISMKKVMAKFREEIFTDDSSH